MISVCIATHNGEKYIKKQLESILCQLDSNDEVIISDDGSSDGTITEIASLDDKRIQVYRYNQPHKVKYTHEYVCHNFENALIHAKGDYIFLSDQDDEWFPFKIETCLKELQVCGLVIHNMQIADDNMNSQNSTVFEGGFHFRNYLMKEGSYYGCAMAFNRHILNASLPFPRKLIVHDIWLGLLSELISEVHYIEQPLLLYRIHEDSTSHAAKNSLWHKLDYRIYTLFQLVKRVLMLKLNYKIQ